MNITKLQKELRTLRGKKMNINSIKPISVDELLSMIEQKNKYFRMSLEERNNKLVLTFINGKDKKDIFNVDIYKFPEEQEDDVLRKFIKLIK